MANPCDNNETTGQRFLEAWDKMNKTDQKSISCRVRVTAVPARISGGLMNSQKARAIFTALLAVIVFALFYLAPRMPRSMVAAGIVLGAALAIIVIMMWLFGSSNNKS